MKKLLPLLLLLALGASACGGSAPKSSNTTSGALPDFNSPTTLGDKKVTTTTARPSKRTVSLKAAIIQAGRNTIAHKNAKIAIEFNRGTKGIITGTGELDTASRMVHLNLDMSKVPGIQDTGLSTTMEEILGKDFSYVKSDIINTKLNYSTDWVKVPTSKLTNRPTATSTPLVGPLDLLIFMSENIREIGRGQFGSTPVMHYAISIKPKSQQFKPLDLDIWIDAQSTVRQLRYQTGGDESETATISFLSFDDAPAIQLPASENTTEISDLPS